LRWARWPGVKAMVILTMMGTRLGWVWDAI
jgi:hypothetical protein